MGLLHGIYSLVRNMNYINTNGLRITDYNH